MPLKEAFAPSLNRVFKFGRRRPVGVPMRLKLENFLRASLPTPPSSCDFSSKAGAADRDVYGNDALGDCVVASRYHGIAAATGNAGTPFHATLAAIIKDYSAISGYVPGDPSTDNGCVESDAQTYWGTHGYANGTKPLGAISVNAANKAELMAAIYLFEGADICMELPDAWISPFPGKDDFVWDVGTSDPSNGHCIQAVGYDSTKGIRIDTWALYGWLTWAAAAKLAITSAPAYGSVYAVLTPDLIAKGADKSPTGLNWAGLIQAFDSLGGNVPIPTPVVPPPAPTPGSPVTLAQAEAWASSGITSPLYTKAGAIAAANAGLSKNWPKS
jgi:hypothetical protein